MARPRVYRDDARCPECGSNWMPKDGTSKGCQVYHCRDCGRRTIPDTAYQRPSAADKERWGCTRYPEPPLPRRRGEGWGRDNRIVWQGMLPYPTPAPAG